MRLGDRQSRRVFLENQEKKCRWGRQNSEYGNSQIKHTFKNLFIWGNQFTGSDQTYVCCERKACRDP